MSAVREDAEHRRNVAPRVSRTRRSLTRMGVAAAVVALAGSLAWNATLVSRLDGAEQRAASLAPIWEVATDPSTRFVALRGKEGTLTLAFRPARGALLVGRDLPSSPRVASSSCGCSGTEPLFP